MVSELAASLSIGQVADRTGLSVHAVRLYEREGTLANPVRRGPGGRRVYREDVGGYADLLDRAAAEQACVAIPGWTYGPRGDGG
jgi:MerR family regulatory protein